jgi:hypothetical protein
MYKEKYLKYKTKYLDLKSQLGGDINPLTKTTDKQYSFINWEFDSNKNNLIISYESEYSDELVYRLSIHFKKSRFTIFGNEVELKYGTKDKLKTVNLANKSFELPYIAYYILYTLIKSISIFDETNMIALNNPANIKKYPKWKQILVSAKDIAFKKTFSSNHKEVNIKFIKDNETVEEEIVEEEKPVEEPVEEKPKKKSTQLIIKDLKFIYDCIITIDFTKNQIYDDRSILLQNMFDGSDDFRDLIQLKLVDICIWLIELDDEKRNIFMKGIAPININNESNIVEILKVLKEFSQKMKNVLENYKKTSKGSKYKFMLSPDNDILV